MQFKRQDIGIEHGPVPPVRRDGATANRILVLQTDDRDDTRLFFANASSAMPVIEVRRLSRIFAGRTGRGR